MTNGQPYLIQLICRNLVLDLNQNKKRNTAIIDDVDDVVDRLIASGSDHFSQHIWKESTLPERLLLSAAAEELTLKQLDVAGMETIFDRVESVAPSISRKDLMEALERLTAKEILHEKNLRLRFPVNLFRKWLHHRHPLVKVRAEI